MGAAGSANSGSAGSPSDDEEEPGDDEGGCALPSKPGGSAALGLFSLLALALGLVRRRR
jgi:MYXO-CTERM domain-containing protein